MSQSKSRKKRVYLHGFSKEEQKRLYEQARFLEPYVYERVDFRKTRRLLEVGCGVGAQTKILLERFPHLHITGIDASEVQLRQAEIYLKKEIARGQVELILQDAQNMSLPEGKYDGAFLTWFLEHVPSPLTVLKELNRILAPGSVIYCNEVQNASLFVEPYSPAILKYWALFNDVQWTMGGHPFVGASLGNLLDDAGFEKIGVEVRPFHFDSRQARDRAEFIGYWTDLLLSAAPVLKRVHRLSPKLLSRMKRELALLKRSKESVFFYTWIQARALTPGKNR